MVIPDSPAIVLAINAHDHVEVGQCKKSCSRRRCTLSICSFFWSLPLRSTQRRSSLATRPSTRMPSLEATSSTSAMGPLAAHRMANRKNGSLWTGYDRLPWRSFQPLRPSLRGWRPLAPPRPLPSPLAPRPDVAAEASSCPTSRAALSSTPTMRTKRTASFCPPSTVLSLSNVTKSKNDAYHLTDRKRRTPSKSQSARSVPLSLLPIRSVKAVSSSASVSAPLPRPWRERTRTVSPLSARAPLDSASAAKKITKRPPVTTLLDRTI